MSAAEERKAENPEQWEDEHWLERLYYDEEQRAIIPVHVIRKAVLDACSFVDSRPGIGKLGWRTLVQDCMNWSLIGVGSKIECDQKRITQWRDFVNPNPSSGKKGGGGVLRIRPLINLPWACGFSVQTTHECFDRAVIDEIFSAATEIKGLGEGRAYRGYGRARSSVVEFDG